MSVTASQQSQINWKLQASDASRATALDFVEHQWYAGESEWAMLPPDYLNEEKKLSKVFFSDTESVQIESREKEGSIVIVVSTNAVPSALKRIIAQIFGCQKGSQNDQFLIEGKKPDVAISVYFAIKLERAGEREKAVDRVYEVLDKAFTEKRFREVDDFLENADIKSISRSVMIALIANAMIGRSGLSSVKIFLTRIVDELAENSELVELAERKLIYLEGHARKVA